VQPDPALNKPFDASVLVGSFWSPYDRQCRAGSFLRLGDGTADELAEQRVGRVAPTLVFLRRQIGHLAEPSALRLGGNDRRGDRRLRLPPPGGRLGRWTEVTMRAIDLAATGTAENLRCFSGAVIVAKGKLLRVRQSRQFSRLCLVLHHVLVIECDSSACRGELRGLHHQLVVQVRNKSIPVIAELGDQRFESGLIHADVGKEPLLKVLGICNHSAPVVLSDPLKGHRFLIAE
jgi:hypothetical protein